MLAPFGTTKKTSPTTELKTNPKLSLSLTAIKHLATQNPPPLKTQNPKQKNTHRHIRLALLVLQPDDPLDRRRDTGNTITKRRVSLAVLPPQEPVILPTTGVLPVNQLPLGRRRHNALVLAQPPDALPPSGAVEPQGRRRRGPLGQPLEPADPLLVLGRLRQGEPVLLRDVGRPRDRRLVRHRVLVLGPLAPDVSLAAGAALLLLLLVVLDVAGRRRGEDGRVEAGRRAVHGTGGLGVGLAVAAAGAAVGAPGGRRGGLLLLEGVARGGGVAAAGARARHGLGVGGVVRGGVVGLGRLDGDLGLVALEAGQGLEAALAVLVLLGIRGAGGAGGAGCGGVVEVDAGAVDDGGGARGDFDWERRVVGDALVQEDLALGQGDAWVEARFVVATVVGSASGIIENCMC